MSWLYLYTSIGDAAKRPNHSATSRDGKCVQFTRPRIIVATKPEMHLWNVASLPKSESRRPSCSTAPVSGKRSLAYMHEFLSPSSVGDWCCAVRWWSQLPLYAAQWDAPAVLTLRNNLISPPFLSNYFPNSSSSSSSSSSSPSSSASSFSGLFSTLFVCLPS